ncbi:MAG: adenylate/guanylate cyclase domain-containing protein [Spirochaetes bacterium]|nr:adenylate/guanylate cyclase domain-containing protein [Spirochaetota bacterium]
MNRGKIDDSFLGKKASIVILTILELIFSTLAIAWFFYSEFYIDKTLYNPFDIINNELIPLDVNFYVDINLLYIFYLIPFISVLKVLSVFFKKKIPFLCSPNRLFPIILNIISSALIISLYIHFLTYYVSSMNFFFEQHLNIYITFGTAVLFNFIFVFILLKSLILLDKTHTEFMSFKKVDKLDRKQIKFFLSIQKKLIISIMIIILIIIGILSYFILNDYKKTIIKTVEYIGKTIAEQSASYFKENFNDIVNINKYLITEKDRNIKYDLKFETLSLYKKQGKQDLFIVEYSTDEKSIGNSLIPEEIEIYGRIDVSDKFFNNDTGIHRFVAPIKIQDILLGFSVVRYRDSIIYETFFRAQIRVILLTVLFIYISYILIYIIGNKIVFPLLYLRMNVKKISINLSKMINGEEKISPSLLAYDDEIRTNDEIKVLSFEIKKMTTVIKGIIPYVSFSTLKHTGRDTDDYKIVNKNLTFLFTDIRGFTSLCEGLPPKKIIEMINHYLEVQTEIIIKHKGDIDKFIGDEIMAVFEGQEKELNACKASLELRNVLDKDKIFREKRKLTTVNIGIGINTGPVIYGNVGAKDRKDLTSIGDTVNLASRLEGANKEYYTKTLITEQVYQKVKQNFICREIDLLTVKGRLEPVRIFEVLELAENATKDTRKLKLNFEKALSFYRKKQWDDAYDYFKRVYGIFKDETSKIFIDRIKIFKHSPPPDNWDGVFVLNFK